MDKYSSIAEANNILNLLLSLLDDTCLPPEARSKRNGVNFTAVRDQPYFPIPFKETELGAALKAIEGCLAAALADTKGQKHGIITVDLEKTTAFLFQAYLARVNGLGKLDKEVQSLLKDTDLLQAQSNPYRRLAANLYRTAILDEYYHIHGSLEASTTLAMLGLEPHRPDLVSHQDIVHVIEGAVQQFTPSQIDVLNQEHKQAGIMALKHQDFVKTPHGSTNMRLPPYSVDNLEKQTPPCPLVDTGDRRLLSGIKVLELARIIAGPVIGRILSEYGASVLKVTSANLSDVPFFQVDGNMGKRATELNLKTSEGRRVFEQLLADADVVVDGYRPCAISRLGYGPDALCELAKKRGKGFVYVSENCFGYQGEWAERPGWQQIADCVSGVAWEQGRFMGLDEPVVPPFPISDYGTGCMGAISALAGLHHRALHGGSWHGKVSLLHHNLLLFKAGLLPDAVQDDLRQKMGACFAGLCHSSSVEQVSGAVLQQLRALYPDLVDHDKYLDHWYSDSYRNTVSVVLPVVQVEGLDIGFCRASRTNGWDEATWDFADAGKDRRCVALSDGAATAAPVR